MLIKSRRKQERKPSRESASAKTVPRVRACRKSHTRASRSGACLPLLALLVWCGVARACVVRRGASSQATSGRLAYSGRRHGRTPWSSSPSSSSANTH